MNTLNESDPYFAHLFSMPKKHRNEIDAEADKFIQRKHKNGAQKKQEEEDVDDEAEDFIDHEHLKFKFGSLMSMNIA